MILNELKTNEHTDMVRGSGTDRQTGTHLCGRSYLNCQLTGVYIMNSLTGIIDYNTRTCAQLRVIIDVHR